jgi:protein-S-isoprenylcysteine O-methyltransferase Ste14
VLFVVSGIIKQSVFTTSFKNNRYIMNKKMTPADLFLGILALLLISVSFYQTWLGLQQILGPASFVIALVLSLLLLFFAGC